MRRLWAYIIVVFAAVVAVIASFPSVAKSVTKGGEFQSRRLFTFQLTEKEAVDEDAGEKIVELNGHSAKDIADIMKVRLENYNVSSYDITTVGNDIINVSFPADNDDIYRNIVYYLGFNGSFALANHYTSFVVEAKDFLNGAAYANSYSLNSYPTIIIPVKTDSEKYKTLIEDCVAHPEEKTVEATSEDEEATTENVAKLYFLYNYQPGETYQILKETEQLSDKTLFEIEFEPNDERTGLYYDDNKNSFSQVCGYQDVNGNGYADPSEVKAAYSRADFMLNLFSASKLDYNVKCIKGLADGTEVYLQAKTEVIESVKGQLAWNRTLTTIVAFMIIIALLLVFFYKVGAAAIFTSALASVFFSIIMMVNTGLEYNSLGVVAFVAIAVLGLVSGIIYCNKLKEDSYRGHTLKKANTEASKKSLLPIIDIHVIAIIIGIFTYVFGGVPLRSFAAILSIGGLISLIFSTLGLKGLMWLPTNATALVNRYDLFGIDSSRVPNHMAEEKQTFYGDYANKDFAKRKKPVGIITAGAFVLALVGMITFGALRGGELLKQPSSKVLGNEIYVQNKILVKNDEESPLNDTSLNTILDNILIKAKADTPIDEGDDKTYYTLQTCIQNKVLFDISETKVEEGSANNYVTTYFQLSLSKKLSGNEIAQVKGHAPISETTLNTVLYELFEGEYISDITAGFEPDLDHKYSTIQLKTEETVVNPISPKWSGIILGSAIAMLVITLYLCLRYRLSRGLTSLIFPVISSVITIGIILLFNLFLSMSASVLVAIPVVSLFSYLVLIQFFNKERELLLEDRVKDNSKEHRAEVAKRALGIAFTPILATAVIGVYALINFFGFAPSVMSNAYAMSFVGSLISLGVIAVLVVPVCNLLFNFFAKLGVKFARAPKEKKNKSNKPVKKSAEPEEAIFIGIND